MRWSAYRFSAGVVIAVALALAAVPAASAEGWKVRGGVVWVDPDLEFVEEDLFSRLSLTADGALGVGIGAEYRLTDRLGIEFGVLYAEPEVELAIEIDLPPLPPEFPPFETRFSLTDDLRFTPVSLGLNVHLTPNAPADLYLGPRVAYVFYGDLDLDPGFGPESIRVRTDDEFGYGAGVGLDVPFGAGGWFFHAAADYLAVEITFEGDGSESFDFDPLMVRAGFGVGF